MLVLLGFGFAMTLSPQGLVWLGLVLVACLRARFRAVQGKTPRSAGIGSRVGFRESGVGSWGAEGWSLSSDGFVSVLVWVWGLGLGLDWQG